MEVYYKRFVHAGAKLGAEEKERLKALNAEESTLSSGFSRKLLAGTKAGALVTTDARALAGLSEAQLAGAAEAAQAREVEGYAVLLQNTTQQPMLAELTDRGTRRALFEASWRRMERGDAHDTRATVARLAQLRAEKGRLLGFASYAAWKLEDQMAKTPGAAIAFMDRLAPAARAMAERELGGSAGDGGPAGWWVQRGGVGLGVLF